MPSTTQQLNERYDEHMQVLKNKYVANDPTPLYLKKGNAFDAHLKHSSRFCKMILPRGKIQNVLFDHEV